jgi:hypothetical protein
VNEASNLQIPVASNRLAGGSAGKGVGFFGITEDNSVAMNREGRAIARLEGFDWELLDRDGVVTGWWRLAFSGEPYGEVDVDFWVRFRFVPAPEF